MKLKTKKAQIKFSRKIHLIFKNNNSGIKKLSNNEKNTITQFFESYGIKGIPTEWHRYYNAFQDDFSPKYIPELLFYETIENGLNRSIMFPALEDKNLLDRFINENLLPKTIIKNINGFFYKANKVIDLEKALETCLNHETFVIKKSIGTFGGQSVRKIDLSNVVDKKKSLSEIFDSYEKDFIIQEVLIQNSQFSALNESSINTLRIMTFFNPIISEVIPLSTVLRMGRAGSFTDNGTAGGWVCRVDKEGYLGNYAIDGFGNRYYKTDNGFEFNNEWKIPSYNSILETLIEEHKNIPHFKLISWDVVLDNNDSVKIIEFNAMGQELNFHQVLNGPIFEPVFSDIIELSLKHDKYKDLMTFGK